MKPVFKPKKNLTKTQKDLMKIHAKHHSRKHLGLMTRFMKEGYCFQQAHEKTMKYIGK